MKRHIFIVTCIAIVIFALPLIIVHILFKTNCNYPWLTAEWSAGEVLTYIAGFESFLGTVALGTLALWQNENIQQQHIESKQPILSMRLITLSGSLYLLIENTGETEAKDICVTLKGISNNGSSTELSPDDLFKIHFELYPKETVQGRVAMSGENIATEIFPQITLHVSYTRSDTGTFKEYDRTVTYNCVHDEKAITNVTFKNSSIESDIDSIARANVRIANYLDGAQIAKFDKVDVLRGKSLKSDLAEVIKNEKAAPLINETDSSNENSNLKTT